MILLQVFSLSPFAFPFMLSFPLHLFFFFLDLFFFHFLASLSIPYLLFFTSFPIFSSRSSLSLHAFILSYFFFFTFIFILSLPFAFLRFLLITLSSPTVFFPPLPFSTFFPDVSSSQNYVLFYRHQKKVLCNIEYLQFISLYKN